MGKNYKGNIFPDDEFIKIKLDYYKASILNSQYSKYKINFVPLQDVLNER